MRLPTLFHKSFSVFRFFSKCFQSLASKSNPAGLLFGIKQCSNCSFTNKFTLFVFSILVFCVFLLSISDHLIFLWSACHFYFVSFMGSQSVF